MITFFTYSLSFMQRKKGSKRIEMIIKTVNKFKLTVVHFARPNSMQIYACAWIYRWTKKTVENEDWATGPSGHLGPWAAGLLLAKLAILAISLVIHSEAYHLHLQIASTNFHSVKCPNT